jgi:hypothetical protein
VHRLAGLAHLAALLLLSRILLPASQLPKGLHWQYTGQEDEKRDQNHSVYLTIDFEKERTGHCEEKIYLCL